LLVPLSFIPHLNYNDFFRFGAVSFLSGVGKSFLNGLLGQKDSQQSSEIFHSCLVTFHFYNETKFKPHLLLHKHNLVQLKNCDREDF